MNVAVESALLLAATESDWCSVHKDFFQSISLNTEINQLIMLTRWHFTFFPAKDLAVFASILITTFQFHLRPVKNV